MQNLKGFAAFSRQQFRPVGGFCPCGQYPMDLSRPEEVPQSGSRQRRFADLGSCCKTCPKRFLATSGRDFLNGFDLPIANEQGRIEIVHSGADMTWKEEQSVAYCWRRFFCCSRHGQMLLARRSGREFGMPDYDASRNSSIG